MKILMVYPRDPDTFWSFRHVLGFVAKRAAFPPLGLLTVAAMLPSDWELKLVDTNVTPLEDRDIAWADWVMLSGMIVHKEAAHEIARRCAAAGRPLDRRRAAVHHRTPGIPRDSAFRSRARPRTSSANSSPTCAPGR